MRASSLPSTLYEAMLRWLLTKTHTKPSTGHTGKPNIPYQRLQKPVKLGFDKNGWLGVIRC